MSDNINDRLSHHDVQLAHLTVKVDTLHETISSTFGHLTRTLDKLDGTMQRMQDSIYGGSGEVRPVILRIAILEKQNRFHNKTITLLLKQNKGLILEDKKQRWKFSMMLYGSILSVTTLGLAYLTEKQWPTWLWKLFG